MHRTVDRTVIDRNTVPNLRKPYKIRWCTVITVPYRITVNRTVHRRVTTLIVRYVRNFKYNFRRGGRAFRSLQGHFRYQ
jgi:hypothetical protein